MQAFSVIKKIGAISTGVAMLGATITGAMALDLAEYPSPFVKSGSYDNSNVFVVGANAAASDSIGVLDIGAGLQFESKVCTSGGGGSVVVSGGVTEEITLGKAIADTTSQTLDQELQDDDVDTLMDSTVSFQSSDYDFQEVLVLGQAGNNVTVETSLTSSEDDYQTDIVMEIGRDSIKYYYIWDEAIAIDNATTSQPLEIKFLGKTLKLTSVSSATKFTAYVGNEYFLSVDDSVEVSGKTVTLKNVGSGGAIVVDVDGVTETIPSSSTETVNGIEISNDETFYDSNDVSQRSATVIVGVDAQETYTDGDAYVGEDKDDPDWVWNIGNLNDNSATTTSTTAEFSGPYLGIENDFVYNDDSDNPPGIGECIDLPNNYLSICLDSLTVADDQYATYYFELDTSADLGDAIGENSSVTALYIHTSVDEGLEVMFSNLNAPNTTSATDKKTDQVWIYPENETDYQVFYKDTSSKKVTLAGSNIINGSTAFLRVNYDSTKGTDMEIYGDGDGDGDGIGDGDDFNLTLVPYDSTYLADYNDNITMRWGLGSIGITELGDTASSEEADELLWNGPGGTAEKTIGTKDEDHRTRYGIIIRDPKSNGASDQVVLDIPANQVKANIVVKGTTASTSTSGGSCTVAEINPKSMLDSEISDATAYNLIVVGGPCANSIAEDVFGVTCSDWPYKAGEGVVKLVANGNKAAMLVAGTSALDTRRTAKAIKDYKSYAFSGTEAIVKGTTLSDITVG